MNKRKKKFKLDSLLKTSIPTLSDADINKIVSVVKDYEKHNLDVIESLKRERKITHNRISGALKDTINTHGPITKILIGSATKRIYGSLLSKKKENLINKIIKWIKS